MLRKKLVLNVGSDATIWKRNPERKLNINLKDVKKQMMKVDFVFPGLRTTLTNTFCDKPSTLRYEIYEVVFKVTLWSWPPSLGKFISAKVRSSSNNILNDPESQLVVKVFFWKIKHLPNYNFEIPKVIINFVSCNIAGTVIKYLTLWIFTDILANTERQADCCVDDYTARTSGDYSLRTKAHRQILKICLI